MNTPRREAVQDETADFAKAGFAAQRPSAEDCAIRAERSQWHNDALDRLCTCRDDHCKARQVKPTPWIMTEDFFDQPCTGWQCTAAFAAETSINGTRAAVRWHLRRIQPAQLDGAPYHRFRHRPRLTERLS